MDLYEKIIAGEEKISIIGLGYIGIPLLIAFAKKADVIGFDIDEKKIEKYKKGMDLTKEVGNEALEMTTAGFTFHEEDLKKAKFHIVAVPTPVHPDKAPDMSYIINASKIVGRNLTKGSIVVYESTVYPGTTEEICVPILEEESGLTCGEDFKIGYSPERINPGDKIHRLQTITKIVSAMDQESLDIIAKVYGLIIDAGIYKAESIKVAEASKIIENTQRDVNIAFINEVSIILDKLGIDTKAAIEGACTKWNFMRFIPGLVGGHCIGVDPYYLIYRALQKGYHPEVMMACRKINDSMGKHIAESTIKMLIKAEKIIKHTKVAVMGIAFKENCSDIRNTKVLDIVKELEAYELEVRVVDPVVDTEDVYHTYKIVLEDIEKVKGVDVIIVAVAHDDFKALDLEGMKGLYIDDKPILIDVKGIFNMKKAVELGYFYWRL